MPVLDGTKTERNCVIASKLRSNEAIVYFQSNTSFQDDCAIWCRRSKESDHGENMLADFACETAKDNVSGTFFSFLSELKPLSHFIRHKDIA